MSDLARIEPAGAVSLRMTPEAVKAQVEEVKELQRSVLTDGVDFGHIAGQRPTLFKPGAEWLLKWANYGHRMDQVEVERDEQGRKYGVTYRCTVFLLNDNTTVVSTCDGYCGYDEPDREEHKSKWGKLVPRSPWNTIIKMAQKRALVGATLQATCTSGLFTQDLEDSPAHVEPEVDPYANAGWLSRDAHDEARDALMSFLHDTLTNDAQREAFREWRGRVGIDFTKLLTAEQMQQARVGAEQIASGERPTEGGANVGSVGTTEPSPVDEGKVGEDPTDPAETRQPLRVPPVPAEGRQGAVVDVDARQVDNVPQAPAEAGETADAEEPCPACLGGPTQTLNPSCSTCEGIGFVHNGIAAAARFAAESRRRAHEPAGDALFAGDACERCGSTRTNLVNVQGAWLCERASDCTKRANARAEGQADA